MATRVALGKNKHEEALWDNKAELYAVIKATEKLERAYVRDAIPPAQYEEACNRLIQQFKTLWGSLKEAVPNVERFMAEYNMQCPMAASRLLYSGLPATVEHKTTQRVEGQNESAAVAETVQLFITGLDQIKLGMTAVDEITPLLRDLRDSMIKLSFLPAQFGATETILKLYQRYYQMPATYQLNDEDQRQFCMELETAYNAFLSFLKSIKSR